MDGWMKKVRWRRWEKKSRNKRWKKARMGRVLIWQVAVECRGKGAGAA